MLNFITVDDEGYTYKSYHHENEYFKFTMVVTIPLMFLNENKGYVGFKILPSTNIKGIDLIKFKEVIDDFKYSHNMMDCSVDSYIALFNKDDYNYNCPLDVMIHDIEVLINNLFNLFNSGNFMIKIIKPKQSQQGQFVLKILHYGKTKDLFKMSSQLQRILRSHGGDEIISLSSDEVLLGFDAYEELSIDEVSKIIIDTICGAPYFYNQYGRYLIKSKSETEATIFIDTHSLILNDKLKLKYV